MKRVIWIVLAAALCLAGCQAKGQSSDTAAVPQTTVQSGTQSQSSNNSTPTSAPQSSAVQDEADSAAPLATASDDEAPKKLIDFTAISQYPELPTGCEVTSLAMVLQHYGINIDKCDIGDKYLDKGEVGTVNFYEAFEGDPRDENSFGCYAPVIVNAAQRILAENNSALKVNEVTGGELESLFAYIDRGVPVIVWGTQDCQPGHYSVTWNVNGEDLTWFTPEHCMVLVGYSDSAVWIADPIYGEVKVYDKEVFKSCYNSLYKQAVVIE